MELTLVELTRVGRCGQALVELTRVGRRGQALVELTRVGRCGQALCGSSGCAHLGSMMTCEEWAWWQDKVSPNAVLRSGY